jgi:FkbM family methyltransferase
MLPSLQKLTGRFPERWQQNMKRVYFARQIRHSAFQSEEPEFKLLEGILTPGDWAIDVGANIGHYTLKMSDLVKSEGRVIAMEPIPYTFELLAANCALSPYKNITLLNAAASSSVGVVKMEVPEWERGGSLNYYEARIVPEDSALPSCGVMTLNIDNLQLSHRISLVKIDAEGHEQAVVEGMAKLLQRDHPILVVEGGQANSFLESLGYAAEVNPGSPNCVWRYGKV